MRLSCHLDVGTDTGRTVASTSRCVRRIVWSCRCSSSERWLRKQATRFLAVSAASRGASGPGHSSNAPYQSWQVPTKILNCDYQDEQDVVGIPLTVYTVRITTSYDRGSALSDYEAGVNLCFVSRDGRALLKRVGPVYDPEETEAQIRHICRLATEGSGADCTVVTLGPTTLTKPSVKRRFQEGQVDEISFLGPELGPLSAIMVAPEGGSWVLDEVDVASSRSNHLDRFVCRKRLGGRNGEQAAYLTPVPPGAVVYGSGDSAVILTKEQASVFHAWGMSEYEEMKQRLLLATASLAFGGSGLIALFMGPAGALPFAIGGLLGVTYQLLLQKGVDSLPGSLSASKKRTTASSKVWHPNLPNSSVTNTPAFRMGLVVAAGIMAFWCTQDMGGHDGSAMGNWHPKAVVETWQIGLGVAGFMMYKVALLGVSLVPSQQVLEEAPAKQVEKNT